MLVRQKDDARLGPALQPLNALLENLALNGLPLPVQGAQLLGQSGRAARVPGEEELGGQIGLPHPPRRVDPGGQGVADGHRGHRLVPQAGLLHQLGQPHPPGVGQGGQPGLDNGPVLPRHGHHVGHGAHRRQIGVLPEHQAGPVRSRRRHGQLQGHPHAGQPLEGVGTVGAVGVHHRRSLRDGLLALMVVGDDHVNPQLPGKLHLPGGGDAAVHRDDQRDPLPGQVEDRLLIEAVALLQPVGDVGAHPPPQPGEAVGEQTGGRNAVHVVVPIDRNGLPPLQGPGDPEDRPVHVLEQHGVQQRLFPGGEQLPGLLRLCHAPGGQDAGQKGGNAGPLQLGPPLRGGMGDFPLLIPHGRSPPSACVGPTGILRQYQKIL